MCSNDVQFDFSADFGDSNYKSCFARSVAVNSQFHSKSLDVRQLRGYKDDFVKEPVEVSRLRKVEESPRRFSTPTPTITPTTPTSSTPRRPDLPVENLALQSQVELLRWQLRQAEGSRRMYRELTRQVVAFLERARRRLDRPPGAAPRDMPRTRSEFHVEDARGYGEWRRPKQKQQSPDEISSDKLSQEAFRLLRTAQSLLNTREPDLAHVTPAEPKDQEFLSQLAKEFPRTPQRATSFSMNPQLISPSDREVRISTAFNRKLSLQRTPSRCEDGEFDIRESKKNYDGLPTEYAKELPTEKKGYLESTLPSSIKKDCLDSALPKSCLDSVFATEFNSIKKNCLDSVLSTDKTTGSVSSAEDESGFSSMNSFQEVGLPISNSTLDDENFGDLSVNSSDSNITQINLTSDSLEKAKLMWNRSEVSLPTSHRRWSSTPVDVLHNDPLKVLWV